MKVTDPDNLDRFQIAIDPVGQIISLRGLGTQRHAVDTTGDSDGTTTFTDAGANFTTDGVIAGDVLTIISDPAANGGIIGHYRVVTVGTTTLTVERSIPASTAADLTYRINAPQTVGAVGQQVADGVSLDVLYSFFAEEWVTLAAGLGNAEDLNQFTFPMRAVPATVGQYIFGGINGDATSAWTFAATNGTQATDGEGNPTELIRDGGLQERSATGVVLREYANYTTLGALDADAQPYYQQGDATGSPTDFRIPGPANQAVLVFGPDVGPLANTVFAATTITRGTGSWITDNYRIGDRITIRAAEDAGNNGNFGPITAISATVITIASATFPVNADDDTAIFQVDHRRYTALFARKKERYYTKAVHADAGIPTSGILPLVNKFPLAHSFDPAIVLDDGVLSGGDATGTSVFQGNESHQAAANGVTVDLGDGTFTFSSAGATFTSTARAVIILRAGDVVRITSGGYQGYYEIASVDSATQLTLFHEPLRVYPGDEATLSYTVYAGVRDTGATNATLANVDGATGTLTSAGSTFDANTALGDRIVVAGDVVEVFAGTGVVLGYYRVVSVTSATVLVLNTSDQIFSGETSQSYRIWRPGMFLQRFDTDVVGSGMSNMAFNGAGNPDTMTRTGGSWITDGFIDGMALTVVDAEDAANVGTYIIDGTPSATVVTFIAEESLTTNATDTTAINANITGETGIVRTINAVTYPFHWRLFANGGTLAEAYQFLQRDLRRTTDIDGSEDIARGDITDLLMSFVSPNGTTLDLFPDNLASSESNNVTYRDLSADDRANAFLVGIRFVPNANLIGAAIKRLTMYFTSVPSGDFDSNDAVVIDDSLGVDINFTVVSGNIDVTYDYTNNAQGGRTPGTDAPYVVVAYGTNLAQPLQIAGTITQINSIIITVAPQEEFNYANV